MIRKHPITLFRASRVFILLAMAALPSASWATTGIWAAVEIGGSTVIGEGTGLQDKDIEILSFGNNISRDTKDATTGGAFQYRPVRILKNIDNTSPLFLEGMAADRLVNMTIKFWRSNATTGAEEMYYTIEISGAVIVGIMPSHSSTDAASPGVPAREVISLEYTSMTVTSSNGATATIPLSP